MPIDNPAAYLQNLQDILSNRTNFSNLPGSNIPGQPQFPFINTERQPDPGTGIPITRTQQPETVFPIQMPEIPIFSTPGDSTVPTPIGTGNLENDVIHRADTNLANLPGANVPGQPQFPFIDTSTPDVPPTPVGATQPTTALSDEDFVQQAYQNVFGRGGDPEGVQYYIDKINDPNAPDTRENLEQTLRNAAGEIGFPGFEDTSDRIQLFQPDLFPSSRSGLPEGDIKTLLGTLIPQLTGSIGDFRSDIDTSTKAASELFGSLSRGAIEKDATRILNELAASNVLDSSVASDALSKSLTGVATAGAGKGFEAAALAAAQKAKEPELLARIADLGRVSESSAPGEPYDRILRLL